MTAAKELNTKKNIVKFLEWLNDNGYIMEFDYEQISESYLGNKKPTDAISVLSHYQKWRIGTEDDIKHTSKDITMAFNEVLEYFDMVK